MFFKKEKKYVGDYKNGKMHGNGTLIIGHFSKIFKKTLIKTLPRTKYVGEFKNDKMHGTGTFQLHASKKIVLHILGNLRTIREMEKEL